MLPVIPNTGASVVVTVDATEEDFALALTPNSLYVFVSSTNCWIKQGTAPIAATAASGSMFVPANTPLLISGNAGAALSVLRDTADGKASLTPCSVA
jgi:hypothetical protein